MELVICKKNLLNDALITEISNKPITLNVGGKIYQTYRETLLSIEGTYFESMFSFEDRNGNIEKSEYFIDRDGDIFNLIIKYFRDHKLKLENYSKLTIENLRDEAEYFMINSLIELIDKYNILIEEKNKKNCSDKIVLNVSGTKFETTYSTLTSFSNNNIFHKLIGTDLKNNSLKKEYFIDRNPEYFKYILEIFRNGKHTNIDSLNFQNENISSEKLSRVLHTESLYYNDDYITQIITDNIRLIFDMKRYW
jgi:hypothetical protein